MVDLSTTIHLLGEVLGDVIRTQESPAFFETKERFRALAKARRLDDKSAGERLTAEVAALSDDAARATTAHPTEAKRRTVLRGAHVGKLDGEVPQRLRQHPAWLRAARRCG